jgi:MFS transporter, OFA family, oxalate/formate antiporter
MQKKITNRWLVVFGAVLLQICIGSIYSWSLFNYPLMNKFGWQESQVVFTFSIIVFVFAFSTIFSGKFQDKFGPRLVATIGGLLYGIGLMLSSTATSIIQLYIYYGIIAGIGVGFVYVCPLTTCVKWFPEKKGFITGIAVGAFGLGSLIFKSIIEFLLTSYGVSTTFLYLGIIYLILIIIGAQFLIVPPSEYNLTYQNTNSSDDILCFTTKEMIKTKSFYLIWIMFLFGTISGLLVIGLATDIGVTLVGLSPHVAANAVAIIGLFNAGGRIILGALSDKLGRIKIVFMMFAITSVCMIIISIVSLNIVTFFICLSGIAFCFGGFLSVFPTITGDFYGLKNLGSNYGIIYQAYGLSALLGPIIISTTGGLKPTFIVSALLSIIGAFITFIVKPPSPSSCK